IFIPRKTEKAEVMPSSRKDMVLNKAVASVAIFTPRKTEKAEVMPPSWKDMVLNKAVASAGLHML
nr:hypothetical protein [Tanacetum cinerariifolium]